MGRSAHLFAAGAAAGRPLPQTAARQARLVALAGDLDSALRLADRVIAEQPAGRREAALVTAAALAQRGQLAHSTELYRWSGEGPAAWYVAVGLIGTGHLVEVPEPPGASADGPPTLLTHAALLAAQGVRESVAGTPITALATLVRAADLLLPAGSAVLLPDSPAALAALVALHCGELGVADSVLARASAAALGGVLLAARHQLLLGWSLMMGGRVAAARECVAGARRGGRPLSARDQLFALALEAALARRESDLPALRRSWAEACEVLMRHPVDLFTLLPLGELEAAAARLGDQARLAPYLAEADALLDSLDNPPLWTAMRHWTGLHAAIIAQQLDDAARHAAALDALDAPAGHGRFHAALSAAARCWLALADGRVDPAGAEAAARGLHASGLRWDGARLAAQAALRTKDRRAMVALLDCARQLQGRPGPNRAGVADAAEQAPDRGPVRNRIPEHARLSARERQVAALVLAGLTYKQIGDRLFISPKTVEHHVARIRQRLDCTSRSDLLARLRELLGQSTSD